MLEKNEKNWLKHIILYFFYLFSALMFLILLQPIDKGNAPLFNHVFMCLYIFGLFVMGLIML